MSFTTTLQRRSGSSGATWGTEGFSARGAAAAPAASEHLKPHSHRGDPQRCTSCGRRDAARTGAVPPGERWEMEGKSGRAGRERKGKSGILTARKRGNDDEEEEERKGEGEKERGRRDRPRQEIPRH